MKVGILTIQDDFNYGNRLQNYAVSEIMKNYGAEVNTIRINNKEDYLKCTSSKIKEYIKKLMPMRLLYIHIIHEQKRHRDNLDNARAKEFNLFNKRYIPMKTYYVNRFEQLHRCKELQNCDFFFAGSDQIWNPNFGMKESYFLTFAPSKKRIAFIASMGVTELPERQAERCAELLKQMQYISVREEAAVQIVKELVGREADCFFDPVLLLGRENWLKIEESVSFRIPSRYVLSFFLGLESKEEIEKFAHSRNAEVIYMNQKEYKKYYSINPAQFLYLIRHAEYILTDSFHVTAFSIIFEKQFFVFRRREEGMENMFSRLETLLGRLDLMNRIQCMSEIEGITPISQKQYHNINRILATERARLDKKMNMILWG